MRNKIAALLVALTIFIGCRSDYNNEHADNESTATLLALTAEQPENNPLTYNQKGKPDNTPPADIAAVTISNLTSTSVDLNWTAVGDDGLEGVATSYELFTSTIAITSSADCDLSGSQALSMTPQAAGSPETYTYTWFQPNASSNYYFCVRAVDDVGNRGGWSFTTEPAVAPITDVCHMSSMELIQPENWGYLASYIFNTGYGYNAAEAFVYPPLFDFSTSSWSGGVASTERGMSYAIPFDATEVITLPDGYPVGDQLSPEPGKWQGGVLAETGVIFGIPFNSAEVLKIKTNCNCVSTIDYVGTESGKWSGGSLAPNGKIYAVPYNSTTVLEIDPYTETTSTFGSLSAESGKWVGAVLGPMGKIYGIPHNATSILEIDPVARTVTTFGSLPVGNGKWSGGVLAADGLIYAIPHNSDDVLAFDPVARTISTFSSTLSGPAKWQGGAMLPNGRIYGIPYNADAVLEIFPVTPTVNLLPINSSGAAKWSGGVLDPSGQFIDAIPFNTHEGLSLSPGFNIYNPLTGFCPSVVDSGYLNKY